MMAMGQRENGASYVGWGENDVGLCLRLAGVTTRSPPDHPSASRERCVSFRLRDYGQRLSDLPCSSSLLYTQSGSTQTFLQRHPDLGSLCFLGNMTGWVENNPCKSGRDGDVLLRSPLKGALYFQAARDEVGLRATPASEIAPPM